MAGHPITYSNVHVGVSCEVSNLASVRACSIVALTYIIDTIPGGIVSMHPLIYLFYAVNVQYL